MNSVRSILRSPAIRLIVAFVAFAAALAGERNEIINDLANLQLTGHHGVMLLALWHMLEATTQLLNTASAVVPSPD